MLEKQYSGVILEDKWGNTYLCSNSLLAYSDLGEDYLWRAQDSIYGSYFLHDLEPHWDLRQIWAKMYQQARPWELNLAKYTDFQLRDSLLRMFAGREMWIWQLTEGWSKPPTDSGIGAGGLAPASGSGASPAPQAKASKPKGGGVAAEAPVAAKVAEHTNNREQISASKTTADKDVSNNLTTEQKITELDMEGHAPVRHGGPTRVSDIQLEDRAVRGIDPASGTQYDAFNTNKDGSPVLHKVGKNATAFTTDEALLKADKAARSSKQFEQNITTAKTNGDMFVDPVELPLDEVFGDDYKSHVRGITRLGSKKNPTGHTQTDFTDGTVKAIYRVDQNGNIKLHTLYPNPKI